MSLRCEINKSSACDKLLSLITLKTLRRKLSNCGATTRLDRKSAYSYRVAKVNVDPFAKTSGERLIFLPIAIFATREKSTTLEHF